MSTVVLGLLFVVACCLVSVAIMIPKSDKRRAMAGAFTGRLALGFVIATTDLPAAGWLRGGIFGLLLSDPDAIITKAISR